MTHRIDVADSRDLLARWCTLAEQRLLHLTELFESGRWRRYYSELAFLQNIREAKAAVETWRALSARGPLTGEFPANSRIRLAAAKLPPRPAAGAAKAARASNAATPKPATKPIAVGRVKANAAEPALEVADIAQRYPFLHNALYS